MSETQICTLCRKHISQSYAFKTRCGHIFHSYCIIFEDVTCSLCPRVTCTDSKIENILFQSRTFCLCPEYYKEFDQETLIKLVFEYLKDDEHKNKHQIKSDMTKLIERIENVNYKFFDDFIDQKIDLVTQACLSGLIDIVKLLVKNGADIQILNENGQNLLHITVFSFVNLNVIEFLITEGLSTNSIDFEGRSPLHFACQRGCLPVIDLLLKNDANLELADKSGNTPIFFALNSIFDMEAIFHFLIKKKVNLSAINNSGSSLLHVACSRGFAKISELCLINGVKMNIVDNEGATAFHYACYAGHSEIIKFFIKNGALFEQPIPNKSGNLYFTLHSACNRLHLDVVKMILNDEDKLNGSINLTDQTGATALFLICSKGLFELLKPEKFIIQLRIVELLIEKGADLDLADETGSTPLHKACKRGNLKLVKFLIEKGANLNLKNKDEFTPLQVARSNDRFEVVRFLDNSKSCGNWCVLM